MNKFLKLTALVFLLTSCQEKSLYNIDIEIEGAGNNLAIIAFIPESNLDEENLDTVQFSEGKILYDYPVEELHRFVVIPFSLFHTYGNGVKYPIPASKITFYLDKGDKIKVEGVIKDRYVDYQTWGNALSEGAAMARKEKIPVFKERIQFEFAYNTKAPAKRTEEEGNAYWEKLSQNQRKFIQQSISFVEKNPDEEYAARMLLDIADKEKVAELYEGLSEEVKNSYFGHVSGDMVNAWAANTPGGQFPSISGRTITDEAFELSSYKGKYLLIDFWGSWCKPCLEEMPELIETSKKHQANLNLLGIACKDNKESLRKAVEKHSISWPQLLEGPKREEKYAQRFGIRDYPTKILLDREGKVVKTYRGVDKALYTDLDSLLSI